MTVPKASVVDNFGKCPVCGGAGQDNPSPGSAFVASDTSFEGVPLYWHKGRLMCQMCIKRTDADEETRMDVQKQNHGQRIRDKYGFRRSMED